MDVICAVSRRELLSMLGASAALSVLPAGQAAERVELPETLRAPVELIGPQGNVIDTIDMDFIREGNRLVGETTYYVQQAGVFRSVRVRGLDPIPIDTSGRDLLAVGGWSIDLRMTLALA